MSPPTKAEPKDEPEATGHPDLQGRTCVVTGASSGIGREIAIELGSAGANVCAIARRRGELEETARRSGERGRIQPYVADLIDDQEVADLVRILLERESGVDALIHSAGEISRGSLATAAINDLDRQYAANVRAPYLLTQRLLPALCAAEGEIVFVNSTAGLNARANSGQFAATQHALRAIADSLREDVNARGVRVLSVYCGRTATPRQARIHALEERLYAPEKLIQPGDVASIVVDSLTLARSAELTDVKVRPRSKP
jgi:NADP-dependent 3-hydroxy acid dehydrogenase YdfG